MNPGEKTKFFTQLATMTRGGLPLSQAFKVLEENLRYPVIAGIRQSIEAGNNLELVFQRKDFSSFEQSFVAAGNQTGQLAESFAALADYWQREVDLRKSIQQSALYPLIVLHLAVFVGPIAKLVSDPGGYLLAVLVNFAILYVAAFALYGFVRRLWKSPEGQTMILRIPVVGSFWKSVYLLRWSQITNMEFNAGIGLPQAVADAWLGTGILTGGQYAQQAQDELLSGSALSELWMTWSLFPKDWKGYLVAGETSGQMSNTLAFLYEESSKGYQRLRKAMEVWVPQVISMVIIIIVAIQIIVAYMSSTGAIMNQIHQAQGY